ncbi:hypothetical protein CHS0354_003655 [Potamilus streckersoni]|uniref:MHD2 domain-containing protein n=1 Tax=Potamilus streckersoni TaxID=2493646 RepID=A0AAE0S9I6_9BIVA|nr:hypothetical protein CHS0354_003655 [Potamilus streckersoni]
MSGSDSSEKHLAPDKILNYLCNAEDQLWVQARIGEAGNGGPIPSVAGDVGSCLLGYGGVVGRVHNYFTNLEQRKCCLLLAACKTTFSNVRIVRNDGRDSGLEEGAMMKSSVDKTSYVVTLDAQEFRVFQQAYVCAAFPVLGAPEPPPDPSPISTPADKQPQRYAYSDLLSLVRPLTPRSLHDSGVEDPEDTSVVPAETLFELLQRAFRLTPERFVQYKKSITAQYQGKSVEMILAEVLVSQLIALEKNSNPFYCPKNFLSRQGYDQWQHLERHHITDLITKFWQFSLPQPSAEQHDQIYTHAHEDYKLLMEKLIRYEYLYREQSELVSTVSTLPLSSASVRLLREFGLRYGVGEQYRRIVYLHYQALNFDPTVWFIQHITFCLTALMDTFPTQRSYLIMVKQEFSLLEETLSTLDARASDALQKMKKLFSANIPKEGLESLIDLLSVTLQAKTYLLMRVEEPLKVKLQKIVQSVFPVAYETHKTVAIDELRQWDIDLSPRLLNMLIGKIRDEVQDYKQKYQATFLRFFDVAEEAAKMFYRLLMADVRKLKLQSEKQIELLEIDLLMLSLAYRLNQLDQDWSQYIYPQMQTWRVAFLQEGFHWLVVMKVHMQEMVTEAVAADKYTHCEVEIIRSSQPSQSSCSSVDGRRHSVSTKSLTPSVHSAFSSISASQSAAGNRLAFSRPVKIQNSLIIPETSFENLHISSQNTAAGQTADRINPKTRRASSDPVTVSEAFSLNESYEAEVARSLGHYDSTDFLSFTHVRHSRSVPDKLYKSYELPTKMSKRNTEKVEKTQYEVELKKDSPFLTNRHHKCTIDLSTEVSVLTSQPVCIHDDLANSDSGTLTDGSFGSHDMESAEEEFSFPPLEEISVTPQNVSTKSCKTATIEDIIVTPVKLADQINTSVASRPQMTRPIITQNSANGSVSDRQNHRNDRASNITISEGQIKGEKSGTTFVNAPNVPQPKGGKAVPVSSSVMDVVVILQRLMGIGCTLCNTLSTVSERVRYSSDPSSGSMESENNVSVNSTSRLEIYDSILTSLCSIICQYADNMLCMDLCGTPQSVARRLAGPRTQQMSGLIWGCRHDLMGDRDCFEYVHKDTDLLCDKHEPITQSMCTRINNVSMMISTLDHCHRRLGRLFAVHSDWSVSHKTGGFHRSAASSDIDSSEFVIIDGYKYDPDVDRHQVLQTASQRFTASPGTVQSHSSQTSSLLVSDPTETYRSHLLAILRAQSRIMAYRLNLFVQDSLPVLLTLKNPRLSIETCLKPIMDFLTIYMQFLSSWLYADNFRRMLECLWIFIVQDFELELAELETLEKDTEKKAHLLIQALSHLLKFMNSQDQSMQKELLLSQSEEVSFRLQLFTLPTLKLISVYRGLQHYQNQVDASSTSTLDQTIQTLREKLRMDLQTFRKCFSGTDLVTWIISNQELFQDFDSYFEESGIVFTREVGYYIAQRLVDLGLIADVEGIGLDNNAGMSRTASFMSSLEFPHLTIFSQLQHGAMDVSDEENTPRGSPTAMHMMHRSLSRATPIRSFHHSGRSSVLTKMLINPLSNAQSLATVNIGNTNSKTVQLSPSDSGCEKTSASDTSSQKVASEKWRTDSDKMCEKTDSLPGFQRAIASDIAFQNNSRLDKETQKSEPGNNSEKAQVVSNYSEDMSNSETATSKVSASECCPQKSLPSEINSQQMVTNQLSVSSVNKVHTSNLNIASIVTYDCTEGGPKQSNLDESSDCFPPLPSSASNIPKPSGSNESLSRKTVMSDNQASAVSASTVTEMSAFQADQSSTECSIIDGSNFCKDNENNNGVKIDSLEDFESLPTCPLDSLAKHCLETPLSTETCDKHHEGNALTIQLIPQERNQNSSSNLDLNKEQQENEALVRNSISFVSNGIHQNSGTADSSVTDESRNISFQVMPCLVSGSKDNQEEVQQHSDTCIFTVTSQVDEARKFMETQNIVDSPVVSLDVIRREVTAHASEALPDTPMPNNSVEYDPYQRQTPVSIRSGLSSASVQILFIDSSEKFYHVTPLTNDQAFVEFGYHMNQELWQLIETCFSRKITEEYILKILFGRQRQDISARDFIRSLPSDLVESIMHPKVNSPNSCVNS